MKRKTCIIYNSWSDMIRDLPPEMAGQLMQAVLAYAFDDENVELDDPALASMLAMIKKKLDEDAEAYERKVERINEARKNRLQKTNSNHNENNMKKDCNHNEIKHVSVSDSVSVSVNKYSIGEKRASAFSPPTAEDVRSYCKESGHMIDADRFVDFYSSKGWMIGKNKMKDWKAAVRNWAKGENARNSANKNQDFPQREHDFDELERKLIQNL